MKRVLLIVPKSEHWTGPSRGGMFADCLKRNGYGADIMPVRRGSLMRAEHLDGYDLVCNHAMAAEMDTLAEYAQAHPAVQVVAVNHSSVNYLEYDKWWMSTVARAIELAQAVPNMWYGANGPNYFADALGCPRIIDFPAPGLLIEPREYREPAEPVQVLIAGRGGPPKNILNQLIAFKMFSREYPAELLVCSNFKNELMAMCRALGIQPRGGAFLKHAAWLEFLRGEPDILLHASMTESYGFVPAEAMQTGVPSVVSEPCGPKDPGLVAEPNNASEICKCLEIALGAYQRCCREAIQYGRESAEWQISGHLEAVRTILGEGEA